MLKCADERNVCETKAYKVYGKMYQNHVDESYAVELVVGRHPEFPGSTGGNLRNTQYVRKRKERMSLPFYIGGAIIFSAVLINGIMKSRKFGVRMNSKE